MRRRAEVLPTAHKLACTLKSFRLREVACAMPAGPFTYQGALSTICMTSKLVVRKYIAQKWKGPKPWRSTNWSMEQQGRRAGEGCAPPWHSGLL